MYMYMIFKLLLLGNCLANQNQILCGASMIRGNENVFAAFGSHDQDGRHAHMWLKPSILFFLARSNLFVCVF